MTGSAFTQPLQSSRDIYNGPVCKVSYDSLLKFHRQLTIHCHALFSLIGPAGFLLENNHLNAAAPEWVLNAVKNYEGGLPGYCYLVAQLNLNFWVHGLKDEIEAVGNKWAMCKFMAFLPDFETFKRPLFCYSIKCCWWKLALCLCVESYDLGGIKFSFVTVLIQVFGCRHTHVCSKFGPLWLQQDQLQIKLLITHGKNRCLYFFYYTL